MSHLSLQSEVAKVDAGEGVSGVHRALGGRAAEAFFTTHEGIAASSATGAPGAMPSIRAARIDRSGARRQFNEHAYADRRPPPGGNPSGRGQGKPRRGV